MGNRTGKPKAPKKPKKPKHTLRILTLGISGSGKTTFAKQMKIIALGGFQDEEIRVHKEIVLQNVLVGIQELIKQAEKLEYNVDGENLKHCRYFAQMHAIDTAWNEKMGEKIKLLWTDPAIQRTWKAAPNFQLQMIHFDYYMEHLDRISRLEYNPTNEDMLRARQRTTGEQNITFIIDKVGWDLIDVGGQRPERYKWEGILDSKEHPISGVIFFAALDEYNMISNEEVGKTKMDISLQVFRELCQSKTLQDRPYIALLLFLNKIDLLENKLKSEEDRNKFKEVFPEYTGDLDSACECVKDKFQNSSFDLKINTHFICALNTDLMEDVFRQVRTTIFDTRITYSGVRI
jgi:GTPase SAR1 family protein